MRRTLVKLIVSEIISDLHNAVADLKSIPNKKSFEEYEYSTF